MSLVETAEPRAMVTVGSDLFSDPATFEHAQRVAKVYAASSLIPEHLRGNVADCLIALQIARRLNEDPLTVLQNIYVVSGRPGFKTEYMISRARRSGVFKGPITWRTAGQGDTLAVTAVAILADTGEEIAVTTDMRMAKAEQWTRNPKYASMPEHMLRWRSAAMLIRLYAPEVMIGVPIIEEVEMAPAQMRDVTPARSIGAALDAFSLASEKRAAEEARVEPETEAEGADLPTDPAPKAAQSRKATAAPAADLAAETEAILGDVDADPRKWSGADLYQHGQEARRAGRTKTAAVPKELQAEEYVRQADTVRAGWDAEAEAAETVEA